MNVGTSILCALAGVVSWSFLEYVIHRWLGHDRRFRRTPFGKEHVRHHIEGDYFAPTEKKVPVAVVATALLAIPAVWLAGRAPGLGFVAGFIFSYAGYEVLHRREHTHPGIGAYGRWARRHHFYHHFVDARQNMGVTSPLWDLAFGTYRKPSKISVPPRLCMSWLKDPATGEIRAEHASAFVLGASRARSS